MADSVTVTTSPTSAPTMRWVMRPAVGTAIPSAMVGPPGQRLSPSARAVTIDGYLSVCTPTISMPGLSSQAATATPPMSPPPPTGMASISRSGWSVRSSSPTVPAPAMMNGSSNGGTRVIPSSASWRAWTMASPTVSPLSSTVAPRSRVRLTLRNGVVSGITMVAAMPSRPA